jgi:hypothetical protein
MSNDTRLIVIILIGLLGIAGLVFNIRRTYGPKPVKPIKPINPINPIVPDSYSCNAMNGCGSTFASEAGCADLTRCKLAVENMTVLQTPSTEGIDTLIGVLSKAVSDDEAKCLENCKNEYEEIVQNNVQVYQNMITISNEKATELREIVANACLHECDHVSDSSFLEASYENAMKQILLLHDTGVAGLVALGIQPEQ